MVLACVVLIVGSVCGSVNAAEQSPADVLHVDALLGNGGREAHARRLADFTVNGKTYPWSMWADWGKALVHTGFVEAPPVGEKPSKAVSEVYTCVRCHTTRPESQDPSQADPDAALAFALSQDNEPRLTQGAGFYGLVNRTGFYAGLYAKYHRLCVPKQYGGGKTCLPKLCWPGCRKMDPVSLEDAIQVCAKYCSVGRYLEEWEMLAMLTYFWDLELTLDDLLLSPEHRRDVLAVFAGNGDVDDERLQQARQLVSSRFLPVEPFTQRPKAPGENPPEGDADRGLDGFAASCQNCHTKNVARLIGDVDKFYGMVAKGSGHSKGPYMPEYALERLSRQQLEDIRAYLEFLASLEE
ncbi:MAG: cytochrome c [Okeania sp. SIO3B3]|nr:cytochrome c [Okeania sp. SIO3B3]